MVRAAEWEDVQEENGWIHHTAPQWNRHWGGPLWSSAGINVAWEHYLHFGDVSILRDHYASHRAWLEFLHTKSPTGLLEPYAERGWYLGDWAAPWGRREFGDKQAAYFNNCVYALVLEKMIQIALVLDQVDDARDYEARRETLKRRINDTYLDHPSSRYMEGNQVQTAFALLAGIVPPSRIGDSEDHLARSLEADDAYLDMGSSGLPVLLNYLTTHPRYDEAVNRILSKVTEPGYGYFLAKGETTWPEHWSSDVESRMHTCYTGISSWFVKRVLGIRANPAVAGYRSILLEPAFLRDLSHAHGQAATPYGPVTSAWSKSDDLVTWKIILPIGTTAEVRIPAHDENLVLESGGPLQAAVAEGIPVITLNSGSNDYQPIGALTHVGQSEDVAGNGAGERFNDAGATKVLCAFQEQGNVGLEERCNGLAETFGGETIIEFMGLDADTTEQQNTINAFLAADPDIDGVLGVGPVITMSALRAAQDLGRDDITIGGFDLTPELLDAIAAGEVAFTVDQQQYLQGYMPVLLMYLNVTNQNTLGGGLPILTGPGFVTPDNAADVIALSAEGTR